MKTLIVKILEVTAKTPANDPSESDQIYQFKAYEYPNGVCSVSYEHTHDGFFLDSSSIQACGLDEIVEVSDTGETFEMSIPTFSECLAESVAEFGNCEATLKALELTK
jgi:hypothetical protein